MSPINCSTSRRRRSILENAVQDWPLQLFCLICLERARPIDPLGKPYYNASIPGTIWSRPIVLTHSEALGPFTWVSSVIAPEWVLLHFSTLAEASALPAERLTKIDGTCSRRQWIVVPQGEEANAKELRHSGSVLP